MNVHDWTPTAKGRVLLALALAATASTAAEQDAAKIRTGFDLSLIHILTLPTTERV